ncbi:MAG TPA: hypothetical protein PKZ27_00555 [Rhodocyclaceae bacterium]|nr:hypothetical protein [Rhodocyclaceae bacterium]
METAEKSGINTNDEAKAQRDRARRTILIGADLLDWLGRNIVGDADRRRGFAFRPDLVLKPIRKIGFGL